MHSRKTRVLCKDYEGRSYQEGCIKVFEVGEVVVVPLADVNKVKIDAQNLMG